MVDAASTTSASSSVPVAAWRTAGPVGEQLVREEPLQIRLAARGATPVCVWTTLRTPGNDLDLALGWAVAEGHVRTMTDVVDVHHCDETGVVDRNAVTVRLDREQLPDDVADLGVATGTAACGLCGRDDLHALLDRCPPAPRTDVTTDLDTITTMLGGLPADQPLFARTGGAHAAALATADGHLLAVREDVGRHNAVDAAVGATLRLRGLGGDAAVLLLSGRAGFELVAKAIAARVAVVAAAGAATDLAAATARAAGLTLVTFVGRAHGGTVLSGPGRLGLGAVTDERDAR